MISFENDVHFRTIQDWNIDHYEENYSPIELNDVLTLHHVRSSTNTFVSLLTSRRIYIHVSYYHEGQMETRNVTIKDKVFTKNNK